jgi:hypothetical protein
MLDLSHEVCCGCFVVDVHGVHGNVIIIFGVDQSPNVGGGVKTFL